ncbi:MAG: hypothetical protein H6908_05490 [Hyphomicrobiales bacterium]|nr:hypothetical protein [Hyphomicrobiales bacterium]
MSAKHTISLQPWMQLPDVKRVMDMLEEENGIPRFVGGCVRNALLYEPIYDIDIGTVHRPEKVIELCEKHGLKAIPTGIRHGTVRPLFRRVPAK